LLPGFELLHIAPVKLIAEGMVLFACKTSPTFTWKRKMTKITTHGTMSSNPIIRYGQPSTSSLRHNSDAPITLKGSRIRSLSACTETDRICLEELKELQCSHDTYVEGHGDCYGQYQKLTSTAKQKKQSPTRERDSFERVVREHEAYASKNDSLVMERRSLKQSDEEHKVCASKLHHPNEQLRDHKVCQMTIEHIKGQINHSGVHEQHARQVQPAGGQANMDEVNSLADPLRPELEKIEADFRRACALVAKIYDGGHVKRKTHEIQKTYHDMAHRLRQWLCSNIRHSGSGIQTEAIFADFLRDVVAGFDVLAQRHHKAFAKLGSVTAQIRKMHTNMHKLQTARDSWRHDCMAVLEKAQRLHIVHDGKESKLCRQLMDKNDLVAELQGLVEDTNMPQSR
jgi:hypothetical protein